MTGGNPASEFVTLKVVDKYISDRVIYCNMRPTEKLQELMEGYYDIELSVQCNTGRFVYYGRILRSSDTPAQLGMKDGDEVDFFDF
ncbi:hypothetical protein GUJ93_ZPchr0005g15985 [Zizania palustris]|uniref:Ubiquitin-like domain-containing protein n=1 Tax=Zizania palustris TaxID=103762 RepID=A0A8J5VGF1_ZIZPA|nr:hypothetical protein GUJ93_ZPchr0005g15985 [Zizania palustris]